MLPLIRIQDLHKQYRVGKVQVPALSDIHLEIKKGEIFGVIGHSGAGKSTLIRCINLLERPSKGQVIVGDVELTALSRGELQKQRRKIGMIFQQFNLLSSATVEDNIMFPLKLDSLSKRPTKQQLKAKVDELLELVGLEEHRNKYPAQLSGGQKQRVGIARALANDPEVLLCDEATSALDPQTTNSILNLLLDINRKLGITIVLITHEMQVIRAICDRVAVIDSGRIVEMGDVVDIFLKPQHPTTKEFVNQISETDELLSTFQHETEQNRSMLRVTFLGEKTYEPVLFETMSETGIPFIILQGTISRMKDVPYGQLIISIEGSEKDVNETMALLRSRGLDVEIV